MLRLQFMSEQCPKRGPSTHSRSARREANQLSCRPSLVMLNGRVLCLAQPPPGLKLGSKGPPMCAPFALRETAIHLNRLLRNTFSATSRRRQADCLARVPAGPPVADQSGGLAGPSVRRGRERRFDQSAATRDVSTAGPIFACPFAAVAISSFFYGVKVRCPPSTEAAEQ
jgi:hypothetical protein